MIQKCCIIAYVYIIMPKAMKRRKSSNMKKRVKKLEEQMEPIVRTFEQRQHDYISAVSAGLEGYALSDRIG